MPVLQFITYQREMLLQNSKQMFGKVQRAPYIIEGLLFMKILSFMMLLMLFSCGHSKNDLRLNYKDLEQGITNQDYIDHLKHLKKSLEANKELKLIPLSSNGQKYLNSIIRKIISKNELLFDSQEEVNVVVIDYKKPICFSLPGGSIYITNYLLSEFLKSEDVLIAVLTLQAIKSFKKIYPKKMLVPIGAISPEKLLGHLKLPLDVTNQLNKWAYIILKRSGYDATAVLSWIQLRNKNPAEFFLLDGNELIAQKEEFEFKKFLADQGQGFSHNIEKNSSYSYYRLISEISRKR